MAIVDAEPWAVDGASVVHREPIECRYRRGPGPALALGWAHGLFCLGCCWALMLVMVVAGLTDLRWMAALAALMAYEKVGRHGRPLARAAGVALLASGAVLFLTHAA